MKSKAILIILVFVSVLFAYPMDVGQHFTGTYSEGRITPLTSGSYVFAVSLNSSTHMARFGYVHIDTGQEDWEYISKSGGSKFFSWSADLTGGEDYLVYVSTQGPGYFLCEPGN